MPILKRMGYIRSMIWLHLSPNNLEILVMEKIRLRCQKLAILLHTWTKKSIGAGSRGQGGSCPLEIFWLPPGQLAPPPLPENCILGQTIAVGSRRRPFFRKHFLLGQEHGPNPAKTFLLRERLILVPKSGPNPAKTQIRRRPIFLFLFSF